MKNAILGLIMLLILATSAMATVETCNTVIVAGKIYESDHITPVANATVDVYCRDNHKGPITSLSDGSYYTSYNCEQCALGDAVTVYAFKGPASGNSVGTVYSWTPSIDVAVVNVSIPEFGVIAASVAMIGAFAGILVLRRH
jgi:hypothetical protein